MGVTFRLLGLGSPLGAVVWSAGSAPERQWQRAGIAFLVTLGLACANERPAEMVDDAPWTIAETPTTVVGAGTGEAPPYFQAIVSVHVAPDGGLFVGDAGFQEVMRIRADGEYLGSLGRRGDGPGEFRGVSNLWLDPRVGSLVVPDVVAGRITEFTADGELIRTVRIDPALNRVGQVDRFEDGRWFVRTADQMRPAPIDGTVRDTVEIFLLTSSGQIERRLAQVPGTISTQFMFQGSTGIRDVLLGPQPSVAPLRNCLLVSSGDSPMLSVIDRSGNVVATFNLPINASPTNEDHRISMARTLAERVETVEDRAAVTQLAGRIRMAEVLPIVYRLVVDDLGYVWVHLHDGLGGVGQDVIILDGMGGSVGKLRLPEPGEIRAVTQDALILTARGEHREQIIKVYGLARKAHRTPSETVQACT